MNEATEQIEQVPDGAAPPAEGRTPFNSMADKLNAMLSGFDKGGKKIDTPPAAGKKEADVAKPADATPTGKTATPPPAEPDVPDIIKSPKAAAEFRNIKAQRDEWRSKYEALEAQAKSPQAPPDYERIRKENEEMSSRLRLLDIQNHPRFKQVFDAPVQDAIARAERAVGKANAQQVRKIMSSPDSEERTEALDEVIEDLSPLQQGRLASALSDYESAVAKRDSEIERAKKDYDEFSQRLNADTSERVEAARREAEERMKSVMSRAAVLEAFKPSDDPNSAKNIEERQKFVMDFVSGKLPEDVYPWVPLLAAEAMYLRETRLAELEKELETTKAQLTALQGASPPPGGGGGPESGGEIKPSGFIGKFKQLWPGD